MCGPAPCDSPDCTWSESFREKSEIKSLLAKTPDQRESYLAAVASKRGQAAADRLREHLPVVEKRPAPSSRSHHRF